MRVLVSSAGTRGDVQPVLALALELRKLGVEVRLCVPPNFLDWVGGFGFDVRPMGVVMRHPRSGTASSAPVRSPTAEQLPQMREQMPDLITDQFDTLGAAAKGCDVVLGANAHQYAARSIAELHDIPYLNALYAPIALPSPDHAPPPAAGQIWEPGPSADHEQRWNDHAKAWNDRALERINHNRRRLALEPIHDVLPHILTDHPWLAADPTLAPLPSTPGRHVTQTGAWILPDSSPLTPELEAFLDDGDPPVYLGFGSMPAPTDTSRTLFEAARAVGRRVILSRGWAELGLIDDEPDCIAIGNFNQQALFPRVAVIVHHGGAGTTLAAACAGVPQVVIPMFSDQFYWASRIRHLGIGTSVTIRTLTTEALTAALQQALHPATAAQAQTTAQRITSDGATIAAKLLTENHASGRLGNTEYQP
jgi:vancomycin aglycone glucosyltransferase